MSTCPSGDGSGCWEASRNPATLIYHHLISTCGISTESRQTSPFVIYDLFLDRMQSVHRHQLHQVQYCCSVADNHNRHVFLNTSTIENSPAIPPILDLPMFAFQKNNKTPATMHIFSPFRTISTITTPTR